MPKNIVKRAAEFCVTPKFERIFDDFARDHADAFMDAVESKDGDVEHKHEYKELHDQFLQLFETELSDFVESEGSSVEEFFSECREISEGQYTALFEEHQYAWFVERLLACMDYKQFYGLMVNEARRQSRGAGQLGLGNQEDYAVPRELNTTETKVVPETITTGGCHSAGWNNRGELYVWGDNEKQQLARARDVASLDEPTRAGACQNLRAHAVACGWSHTLLVATRRPCEDKDSLDQEVFSWGAHEHHQLGRAPSDDKPAHLPFPVDLPYLATGRRVVSISCGWKHSMLVVDDGSVFSWGSGRHGELALGTSQLKAEKPTLVLMELEAGIDAVYCGWQHSVLFSSRSGSVYTCGNNRHGQLGVPRTTEPSRAQPAKVLDVLGHPLQATQVSVGWHFVVCLTVTGVTVTGELLSWGKGAHGQLGLGSFETVQVPTTIPFSERVASIACGSEHTMVVTHPGELFTCGWGEHGNLGHGDTENRSTLTKVAFFSVGNWRVLSAAAGGAVSIVRAAGTAIPVGSS